MKELIRNASLDDFKRGFIWDSKKGVFICLTCGANITENEEKHVMTHGNSIERLLMLEKKFIGLTDVQKEFIAMISNGYDDKKIGETLGCTESTVRNMRFSLRERARQARAFLAIIELAEENMPVETSFRIRSFPVKEDKRRLLLPKFADLFEPNKEYSEAEVNKIIVNIYDDCAIIRRYLVDYNYLIRSADGSKYYRNWEKSVMDKKQLINEYKQKEINMGIIRISNKENGYSYVDICENLYKPFEALKFQLNMGKFKLKYKKFQEDWNKYGEEGFNFEILEEFTPKEGVTSKENIEELKEFLKIWLENQGNDFKLYN